MRKREPRGGLERKILTALLWVAAAPMVLALLIGYAYAHGAQHLAARQNLTMAAQKTAEGLNLTYRARLRTMGTLARDSAIIEVLSSTERDPVLSAQVARRLRTEADKAIDGPADVGLFDAEGRPVAGDYALPGGEPPARVFLPDLRAPTFVDFDLQRHMGYIAAPVRAPVTEDMEDGCQEADKALQDRRNNGIHRDVEADHPQLHYARPDQTRPPHESGPPSLRRGGV